MKQLSKPEVYYAQGNSPKDPGGWTGIVVVEESHISIHTFPKLRFVSIDVYTCKNGLIVSSIEEYFKQTLGVGVFETNFVKRGLNFAKLALPNLRASKPDLEGLGNVE
jgi:S-adenosylmethionine decarboxylase